MELLSRSARLRSPLFYCGQVANWSDLVFGTSWSKYMHAPCEDHSMRLPRARTSSSPYGILYQLVDCGETLGKNRTFFSREKEG
jgi:hypothetical protein